jgi:hypothetical protein
MSSEPNIEQNLLEAGGAEAPVPHEPTTPSSSTEDPPDMSPLLTPVAPPVTDVNHSFRPRRKDIRKAIENAERDLRILRNALAALPPDSDDEEAARPAIFPQSDAAHPHEDPNNTRIIIDSANVQKKGLEAPFERPPSGANFTPIPYADMRSPEPHLAVKDAVSSATSS